jgi:hypothetical protein
LEAKKQSAAAQTEKDRTYFENECASLDRQIDALVYDLNALTEDENQNRRRSHVESNGGFVN